MKKLLIILVLTILFIAGCHNAIYEFTVVKKVEFHRTDEPKFAVTLDFYYFDQILYTDSLYNVGDTLYFSKINQP